MINVCSCASNCRLRFLTKNRPQTNEHANTKSCFLSAKGFMHKCFGKHKQGLLPKGCVHELSPPSPQEGASWMPLPPTSATIAHTGGVPHCAAWVVWVSRPDGQTSWRRLGSSQRCCVGGLSPKRPQICFGCVFDPRLENPRLEVTSISFCIHGGAKFLFALT